VNTFRLGEVSTHSFTPFPRNYSSDGTYDEFYLFTESSNALNGIVKPMFSRGRYVLSGGPGSNSDPRWTSPALKLEAASGRKLAKASDIGAPGGRPSGHSDPTGPALETMPRLLGVSWTWYAERYALEGNKKMQPVMVDYRDPANPAAYILSAPAVRILVTPDGQSTYPQNDDAGYLNDGFSPIESPKGGPVMLEQSGYFKYHVKFQFDLGQQIGKPATGSGGSTDPRLRRPGSAASVAGTPAAGHERSAAGPRASPGGAASGSSSGPGAEAEFVDSGRGIRPGLVRAGRHDPGSSRAASGSSAERSSSRTQSSPGSRRSAAGSRVPRDADPRRRDVLLPVGHAADPGARHHDDVPREGDHLGFGPAAAGPDEEGGHRQGASAEARAASAAASEAAADGEHRPAAAPGASVHAADSGATGRSASGSASASSTAAAPSASAASSGALAAAGAAAVGSASDTASTAAAAVHLPSGARASTGQALQFSSSSARPGIGSA
jgi:hypothetical protein